MTATTNCDPMHGYCVLVSAIQTHLSRRDFINPNLTNELLPESREIVFQDATTALPAESANPIIAFNRETLLFKPFHPNSQVHGSFMSTACSVTISTYADALTNELGYEVCYYTSALIQELRSEGAFVQDIQFSSITHDHIQHPNFYIGKVSIGLQLPIPIWKTTGIQDILRQVSIINTPV